MHKIAGGRFVNIQIKLYVTFCYGFFSSASLTKVCSFVDIGTVGLPARRLQDHAKTTSKLVSDIILELVLSDL